MHTMRTQTIYNQMYDELVIAPNTDMRDSKAVKRIATAYMKLLFPHWRSMEDVNKQEFELFCLHPAIRRRGIIKQQCHYIDPEFKMQMSGISMK